MAKYADSKTKEKWKKSAKKQLNLQKAIEAYQLEQKKPSRQRLGLRKIASMFEGVTIGTLRNRAAEKQSIQEFNATKFKLLQEEEAQLTKLIQISSDWGMPFRKEDIRIMADKLLTVRLGDDAKPVGVNFVTRFIECHHLELHTYRSTHLDMQRANALNPSAVRRWFDLVESKVVNKRIPPEQTYSIDKSRFSFSNDFSYCIVGTSEKKKLIYSRRCKKQKCNCHCYYLCRWHIHEACHDL